MKGIFEEGPDKIAKEEANSRLGEGRGGNADPKQYTERSTRILIERRQGVVTERELYGRAEIKIEGDGQPEGRDNIPGRFGENLAGRKRRYEK